MLTQTTARYGSALLMAGREIFGDLHEFFRRKVLENFMKPALEFSELKLLDKLLQESVLLRCATRLRGRH